MGRRRRIHRLLAGVSDLHMKGMIQLRLVALCSNVAFLVYAFSLHLAPIAILHSALIPVNVIRLIAALRESNIRLPNFRLAARARASAPFDGSGFVSPLRQRLATVRRPGFRASAQRP